MSTTMRLLTGAVLLLAASSASAAELNTLSGLRTVPTPKGVQVVVAGNRAPTFTVFRLAEPDRLVVDLSSADAAGIKGFHEGRGPVSGMVASQFSDAQSSVGRVLLTLADATGYDVRSEGNTVIISVEGPGASPVAPQSAAAATGEVTASKALAPLGDAVAAAPAIASQPLANPSGAEVKPPDVAAASAASDVLVVKSEDRRVSRPARNLTALTYRKGVVKVTADGELGRYELLQLADPPRLALDIYGVKSRVKAPRLNGADLIQEIRVGPHADKVRLVLDARGELPNFDFEASGARLQLAFSAKAAPASVSQAVLDEGGADRRQAAVEIDGQKLELPAASAETDPIVPTPSSATAAAVEVKDVAFAEDANGGRVEIRASGELTYSVERPDERSAVLTLENAKLPKRLERSLDTSALETPVKMVSTFAVPGSPPKVRLVVAASGALDPSVQRLSRTKEGLSWRLNVRGVPTEDLAVSQKTSGFSSESATYAARGAPRAARYTGKRISFEFKDIDIHNLLRIIAEISKKNIVVGDDVGGKITLRLRNVPWDQALELILRSKGLGSEEMGNIVRIAPLGTLESEAKMRAEREKARIVQAPLIVQLISVNYATAGEMASRVGEVLSERGKVTVDTRTNVLIVRDIAEHVAKARTLVQTLDTQTPQVLIESRIVEANTTFGRQIGIQWGGAATMAPSTGNATGLIFPNSVAVRGGSSPTTNQGTSSTPNFAVNMPAPVGAGAGGALGFIFGSAGGALNLNLRLSALENQGAVKTISAPKVTTLDNVSAKISQGVSIPFTTVSGNGANTTFAEARLSLEVTPHITQDGSVMMKISAENNQPDPAATGANGQPAIQRKEANTQVMVKDGDTTVIGGIYVKRGSQSTAAVPFFSKIPVLGLLFKTTTENENRQELLIFITPRIINRQTMAQTL